MKLQYKATGLMLLLGVFLLFSTTMLYFSFMRRAVLDEESQNIKNLSEEIAIHMNTVLESDELITRSFSSAPIVKDSLVSSNKMYGSFTPSFRKEKIADLNRLWMETQDINNPFIQKYLANPVADFLKQQQKIAPGLYGEIFVTNKYGVLVAATGKLTTLSHSGKYWWIESFHDGKGRVFFDDRGYDDSVEGYVLGVVVPVMDKTGIIGIVKSNINIKGPMVDVLRSFKLRHSGKISIVRTKGLIVAEEGVVPLSTSISPAIVPYLQNSESGSEFITEEGRRKIMVFTPIPLTLGSPEYGFGGKYESIDHIKGNEGEAWHVVVSLDEKTALKDVKTIFSLLILAGLLFTLLAAFLASFLGRWFSAPLVKLSETARRIGEGNLNERCSVNTKDEVEYLALSVNLMAENLSKTLISKDKLLLEVKRREKAEKEISAQLAEKEIILKESYHRTKNNFASVSSLLTIQSDSTNNVDASAALKDAAGRVYGMALLYETMLLNEDNQTLSTKEYLGTLSSDIINLFPGTISLKVEKQIDDFQLDSKVLQPLGIIVNELLTNVMKYAFTGRDSGMIRISLKRDKENGILILQDNGNGMPEDFDLEKKSGFGLMLINWFVQQLNGKFTIKSNKGTKSVLVFKIP